MYSKILNFFKILPWDIALKTLLLKITNRILGSSFHFSQTGEDLILIYYLRSIQNGFYIDVGCNHPIMASNTFSLYLNGWKGICIDPNTELLQKFKTIRKNDICLDIAISNVEGEITFYEGNNNLVGTVDSKTKSEWDDAYKYDKSRNVKVLTLNSILEKHKQVNIPLDLLSIDVEGHDFEVLQSIDLLKYKPKLIIVEIFYLDLEKLESNEIYRHLKKFGYRLEGYVTFNAYFVHQDFSIIK